MARAQTIWIVRTSTRFGDPLAFVAAFTVKHECATWLKRQTRYRLPRLVVQRAADNPSPSDAGKRLDYVDAVTFLNEIGE